MNPKDLEFPMTMMMKIIAQDKGGVEGLINHCLHGLGIPQEVASGNHSKKGTYVTFNVEATFESLEAFHHAFDEVAKVEGVRMVL